MTATGAAGPLVPIEAYTALVRTLGQDLDIVLQAVVLDDDYAETQYLWREHRYEPIAGTPKPPAGQHHTFEGVNETFLEAVKAQKTLHAQNVRLRQAAALSSTAAAGLLLRGGHLTTTAAVVAGGEVLATGTQTVPGLVRRQLGRRLTESETAVVGAVLAIELSKLPATVVLSRPLWNLGLGRRLAHLSSVAHDVMVRLADEVPDLGRLEVIAAGVTD